MQWNGNEKILSNEMKIGTKEKYQKVEKDCWSCTSSFALWYSVDTSLILPTQIISKCRPILILIGIVSRNIRFLHVCVCACFARARLRVLHVRVFVCWWCPSMCVCVCASVFVCVCGWARTRYVCNFCISVYGRRANRFVSNPSPFLPKSTAMNL